jgi:hypothetical protein
MFDASEKQGGESSIIRSLHQILRLCSSGVKADTLLMTPEELQRAACTTLLNRFGTEGLLYILRAASESHARHGYPDQSLAKQGAGARKGDAHSKEESSDDLRTHSATAKRFA